MKTIKRTMADIKTSAISNLSKYSNQMQFKGIIEDGNIFAVDQDSFKDAKNVYVDTKGRLASRPTLQKDTSILSAYIPWTYELVDVKEYAACSLYISKSTLNETQTYTIVMSPTDSTEVYTLEGLSNYHISTIAHYIICFNDIGARIIDTNNLNKGWQDFNDFLEIPVIKRVVGGTVTTYDKNHFIPNKYKEQYVWSNESRPQLPADKSAEVELITSRGKYNYGTLSNIDKGTDYRIIKPLNITLELTDIVTVAKDRICIARDNYFYYSFNGGETFSLAYYPSYQGEFLRIASISEDGTHFFFVTSYGVYRCDLSDFTWSEVFRCYDNTTSSEIDIIGQPLFANRLCKFKTKDIFCFITFTNDSARLYFKGPGLYSGTDYQRDFTSDEAGGVYHFSYIDKLGYPYDNKTINELFSRTTGGDDNHNDFDIAMYVSTDYNNKTITTVAIAAPDATSTLTDTKTRVLYLRGGYSSLPGLQTSEHTMYNRSILLSDVTALGFVSGLDNVDLTKHLEFGSVFYAIIHDNTGYQNGKYQLVKLSISRVQINTLAEPEPGGSHAWDDSAMSLEVIQDIPIVYGSYNSIPLPLTGGYIIGNIVYSNIAESQQSLPSKINNESINYSTIKVSGDYFYIFNREKTKIYTNKLQDADSATITYTITDTSSPIKFTKVPNVSYSDTELYLAFGSLLQITYNTVDPDDSTKILFNLPKINNQSFISDINAMINISTTEVALFFSNKITICSKVEDETLGFRYNYYNTKLSTGVRLGDSVINTLEGSYTIFPTARGLAVMNYQAFMATSDQTIEYITDNIKKLWSKFYEASSLSGNQIRIIQHRNRLIFTNNTKEILIYDLSSSTWWRWEIPVAVLVAISNQTSLKVVNSTLLIFKDAVQYYDFSESGGFIAIDWFVQSQPLHMNAPNYYKNLKQLVFQFSESQKEDVNKTMLAQIKLYRKKITVREPETIDFRIEGLRTFVKRFNYWKINEVQWGIANDNSTSVPQRLELNGISIKYEIGDEVR